MRESLRIVDARLLASRASANRPRAPRRPINIDNLEIEMNQAIANVDEHYIRETAYHLWEKDGRPIGEDHRHWEMAKKIAAGSEFSKLTPIAGAPAKKRAAAKTSRRVQ
jgi:hypothetical protein